MLGIQRLCFAYSLFARGDVFLLGKPFWAGWDVLYSAVKFTRNVNKPVVHLAYLPLKQCPQKGYARCAFCTPFWVKLLVFGSQMPFFRSWSALFLSKMGVFSDFARPMGGGFGGTDLMYGPKNLTYHQISNFTQLKILSQSMLEYSTSINDTRDTVYKYRPYSTMDHHTQG